MINTITVKMFICIGAEGAETRDWEESRVEEEATAVSSQGSEPSSPHQVCI